MEFVNGSLGGPYPDVSFVKSQLFRLLPRKAIREQHGGATEPSVRNIDDMLVGGENASVTYMQSHRPVTLSSLSAQIRATEEAHLGKRLLGFPSDYKGAYRQVAACPHQIHLCILCIFNPEIRANIFATARGQLFGGSSAPLNFSRYPDDAAEMCAILFAVIFLQCIDDPLGQEPEESADWAYVMWRICPRGSGSRKVLLHPGYSDPQLQCH